MAAKPAGLSSQPATSWIVSPAFDLLFLANVGWLLFCLPLVAISESPSHVQFWQVYFLTTPHRWLTLWLVASDPDRRGNRTWAFVSIALVAALVVLGTWLWTGAFTCLAVVDFVWNYWHYAAQHGGVLRMYARKSGGGHPRLETWGLRAFVFYAALRLAGWSTGWAEHSPIAASLIGWCDLAICLLPLSLLAVEFVEWSKVRLGKLVYLGSVTGLYGGLLYALVFNHRALVISLTMAAAVFHAVEYMAVVTHYAWRRQSQGSASPFQILARKWPLVLGGYVVVWGLCAYLLDHGSTPMREFWIGLNLWAAALHYAFDGMIWKLRRPQTAQVLGVELPSPAQRPSHSLAAEPVALAAGGRTRS